jgi:tRNA/tmRNA/rRNA uracil-C5-methylase (TrmA/RlmC/RlmD family)
VAQKAGYLARVLEEWSDRLQPVRMASPAQRYAYRDRVTLNARWDTDRGWRFGLMRRDELIAIHRCPVHTPRVNRIVATLVETLPPFEVLPLAYLHVAGTQATLIVKARTFAAHVFEPLLSRLPATGLDGLWVHCHPAAGRKLFARAGWHLLWGQPESIGPDGCVHGPTAFQQLLPGLHRQTLDLATEFLAPGPAVAVLDLYCGIGSSLRRWVECGSRTLGIELAGGAVDAALRNAPAAQVLRGTCLQRLPQVREWWEASAAPRVAYVNPPRSGLEGEVLRALAWSLRPARVAYLSCSAGTLARDLRGFAEAGYVVQTLTPFDFFPGTHHVECLALLHLPADEPHRAVT